MLTEPRGGHRASIRTVLAAVALVYPWPDRWVDKSTEECHVSIARSRGQR